MTVSIPFCQDMDAAYGRCVEVAPGIRRVLADNPSPFTYLGTGTYIVGSREACVIDPGPLDPRHVDAILEATCREKISHILITHTHMDHSPGARILQERCGALTYGFGPHGSGALEDVKVEEGGDYEFTPDVTIGHGDRIGTDAWSMECVHTPGHTSNHLCFRLENSRALFTGDHVMGWSTTVISPPDGSMEAYIRSLELLLDADDAVYWPTHGPPVRRPHELVRALIAHRKDRELQILEQVQRGVRRIRQMVPIMYADIAPALYPAAGRSVLAAVEYLIDRGEIAFSGDSLSVDSEIGLP